MIRLEAHNGRLSLRSVGESPLRFLGVAGALGAEFDPVSRTHLIEWDQRERAAREAIGAGCALDLGRGVGPELQSTAGEVEARTAALAARDLHLYPYQVEGAKWLEARQRALLTDEMGLGKTVMVLAALPESASAVVVCPASAKAVWAAHIEGDRRGGTRAWRPELMATVLQGRRSFRWPGRGEVVILNYDILPMLAADAEVPHGVILVADEAHKLKGMHTARTKMFRALSEAVLRREGRAWALTGTPLVNDNPDELCSVLRCVDLFIAAFGCKPRFDEEFYFRGYPRHPRQEALAGLRAVTMRRLRADVLTQLPPKRWEEHVVDLDTPARDACNELLAVLQKAGLTLEQLAEDRQIAGAGMATEDDGPTQQEQFGSVMGSLSRARRALARCKAPAVVEFAQEMQEAGEPLVVFSAHRAPVEAFGRLEKWGTILGGVPAAQRADLVSQFQGGHLHGLALTIRAGGEAITLTRAHQVAFVDLDWCPGSNSQAEDRLCRIGQKAEAVVIHRFIADHEVDQRVTHALSRKQAMISATIRPS